jgi:sortase A
MARIAASILAILFRPGDHYGSRAHVFESMGMGTGAAGTSVIRRDQLETLTSLSLACFLAGILALGTATVTERFLLGSNTEVSPSPIGIPVPESNPGSEENVDDGASESVVEATPIMPSTLRIPALNVDADVEHVGYTDDGRMDAPEAWEDVAWFQYGYLPGAPGNAVMAGHLDSTTGPAVFAQLHRMESGDQIFVTDEDGNELTFEVTDVESVLAEEAPLDRIFGPSSTPQLNLITCEGHFDPDEEDYDHRFIVYSTLADS